VEIVKQDFQLVENRRLGSLLVENIKLVKMLVGCESLQETLELL